MSNWREVFTCWTKKTPTDAHKQYRLEDHWTFDSKQLPIIPQQLSFNHWTPLPWTGRVVRPCGVMPCMFLRMANCRNVNFYHLKAYQLAHSCPPIHNLFTHIHNAFLVCEHTFSATHLERACSLCRAFSQKFCLKFSWETIDFIEMHFVAFHRFMSCSSSLSYLLLRL